MMMPTKRKIRRNRLLASCLFAWFVNGLVLIESFGIHRARPVSRRDTSSRALSTATSDYDDQSPPAYIDGYVPEEERLLLVDALQAAGFTSVDSPAACAHRYTFSKATGMLRLIDVPNQDEFRIASPPKWIPIVRGEENVLVANGWSFLDPDENEPLSAFDIDAANLEGQYTPKWGNRKSDKETEPSLYKSLEPFSSLGFSLRQLSSNEIETEASMLDDELSKSVLLEGATDPPQRKITNNGYNLKGPASQSDLKRGVFCCAIGGLPLFTSLDMSPTTASSRWLSFSQPVADDHVILVEPNANSLDQRIEVLCAKTRCHLGHYFGKGEGYCINASALNFVGATNGQANGNMAMPISWRLMEHYKEKHPSKQLVQKVCLGSVSTETIVFGAGCFWSVEAAFRRLPGVVSTETGYAGGITASPTYKDVCERETQHAEVVKVTFDPNVLDPRMLVDCFLALHDPTKVRAMGKHARGTGQYRSCIFINDDETERIARGALHDCQRQLDKELSTEIRRMTDDLDAWFWRAEERHQRHNEKRQSGNALDLGILAMSEWLGLYGKRKASVWGSSETMTYQL